MVIIRLLRWLQGYVIFTATGGFPERFLNLTLREDITLINPIGKKGQLTAAVSIKGYKELRELRKYTGVRLRVIEKRGLPFKLHQNKKRWGLAFGAVLFLLLINVMSMFVWTIDISGLDTLSYTQVAKSLQENGLQQGAFKGSINVKKLEQEVTLDLGKISWMAVNLQGAVAKVEISESVEQPDIVPADEPCNIKASAEGQVVRMTVSKGSSQVKLGDGVAKGQLLVSGVVTDEANGVSSFQHSEAQIFVSRESETQVVVPMQRKMLLPTGDSVLRKEIEFFGVSLPVSFHSVTWENYKTNSKHEYIVINENRLPIQLHKEENYRFEQRQVAYNEEQAKKVSNAQLALHDIFALWDKEIVEKKVTVETEKDHYVFSASYNCVENIAEKSPINITD